MISFDHLPLHTDILQALRELSINYVFQPIFRPDGKTVYAWEALMRPTEMTVTDLIADYTKKDKLHVLIENFEYPYFSPEHWKEKKRSVKFMDNLLAADDFGTGLNNMELMEFMSPDIVKLDREVISGIDHISEKQENVKKLVEHFHSKNILVVAEGIEEKEEFEYLQGLGVDLYQGYYLARPA